MVKSNLQTLLDKKGITRYKLAKDADIKYQTIDNYYKDKVVRYDSYILSQICTVLECQVGDILIYQKDNWYLVSML